ncbi:MAG TPA: hypothetical protein VGV57_03055 [Thermoleophilaceae bacterium]|nr:hypothetical protein [Thermoleophilaceae bacterium]
MTWAAAAGATKDETASPTFDVPGGVTVDYVGYWSALTAGTLLGVDDVTAESFAAQGTYQLTDTDIDLLAAV